MPEFKLVFEVEHLLNKALFNDPMIEDALRQIGITREFRGLYTKLTTLGRNSGIPREGQTRELFAGSRDLVTRRSRRVAAASNDNACPEQCRRNGAWRAAPFRFAMEVA